VKATIMDFLKEVNLAYTKYEAVLKNIYYK